MDERFVVDQVLKGNLDAYRQIVDAYRNLVGHMVFRLVSNRSDQEDLCQEVFVKVFENLKSFKFECKLSTWVSRIAYNTSLNFLQKMKAPLYGDLKSKVEEEGPMEDDFADSYWDTHTGLDHTIMKRESAAILSDEIANLPPHYKAIVTLYHVEGFSYEEIGEALKMPDGTVKSHLFRARKILRSRLLRHYTAEELCH